MFQAFVVSRTCYMYMDYFSSPPKSLYASLHKYGHPTRPPCGTHSHHRASCQSVTPYCSTCVNLTRMADQCRINRLLQTYHPRFRLGQALTSTQSHSLSGLTRARLPHGQLTARRAQRCHVYPHQCRCLRNVQRYFHPKYQKPIHDA